MNLNPVPTRGADTLATSCRILRPLSAVYCTGPADPNHTFAFDENCSAVAFLCLAPGGRLVAPVWTCAPGSRSGVLGFIDGAQSLESAQELVADWFAPWVTNLSLGTAEKATEAELALATRKLLDDSGTMDAWLDNLGSSGIAGREPNGQHKHLRTIDWAHATEYAENLLGAHPGNAPASIPDSAEKAFFYEVLPREWPTVPSSVQYLLTLATEALPEGLLDLADQLDYQGSNELSDQVAMLLRRMRPEDVAALQKTLDEGFTQGPLLHGRTSVNPNLLKLPLRYPLTELLSTNLEGIHYDMSSWIRSYLASA